LPEAAHLSAGIILFFLSNLNGFEKIGILVFIAVLAVIYFMLTYFRPQKTKANRDA
jgi:hypothetical protein